MPIYLSYILCDINVLYEKKNMREKEQRNDLAGGNAMKFYGKNVGGFADIWNF